MMARSDEEVLRLMNFIDSQRLKSRTVVGHSVDDPRARDILRKQLRGDLTPKSARELLEGLDALDDRSLRGALAWMHWLRENTS
jgi:hypothetical protein